MLIHTEQTVESFRNFISILFQLAFLLLGHYVTLTVSRGLSPRLPGSKTETSRRKDMSVGKQIRGTLPQGKGSVRRHSPSGHVSLTHPDPQRSVFYHAPGKPKPTASTPTLIAILANGFYGVGHACLIFCVSKEETFAESLLHSHCVCILKHDFQ